MQDLTQAMAAAMDRVTQHYQATEHRAPNRHERRATATQWRRAHTAIPSRKRQNLIRRGK